MNYKEVIEAKYNREAWQQLLHDIFLNKVQFYNSTSEVKVNSRLAKSALYIGRISLSDGESLGIYEVELADKVDIERNKRGIRDMLTKDWKDMGHAGAFMFCYRKNESVLRFSYVSETWGFNKKGDYEKLSTNTKRYTYLLGEGRGCRTAIEQFNALKDSKQSLSDVTAAFSVEALTKQFYKDLFDWYQWAVDPASGVYFPNNTSTEDDDREDIETKIIRMITRIMFVWFIKQKELVPNKIFDVDHLIDQKLIEFLNTNDKYATQAHLFSNNPNYNRTLRSACYNALVNPNFDINQPWFIDHSIERRNYELFENIAKPLLTNDAYYMRFTTPGFMDLNIEIIDENRLAIAHNFELNGDLMADPDVEFTVDKENKLLYPQTYQQDTLQIYERVDGNPIRINELNQFMNQWFNNITDQYYVVDKVYSENFELSKKENPGAMRKFCKEHDIPWMCPASKELER